MSTVKQLKTIHKITGTIQLLTGLHIGGNQEQMKISGMDQPVIKHPITEAPYIPGSSIKGKMRSMLELLKYSGKLKDGKPCACAENTCYVCRIFGTANNEKGNLGPTRILVRDAALTKEWQKDFEQGNLPMEEKMENSINRINGTAENPRPLERVPAGAKFEFNISLKEFEGDPEDLLQWVWSGLALIELDGLGGSVSRGSGQVKFQNLKHSQEKEEKEEKDISSDHLTECLRKLQKTDKSQEKR